MTDNQALTLLDALDDLLDVVGALGFEIHNWAWERQEECKELGMLRDVLSLLATEIGGTDE